MFSGQATQLTPLGFASVAVSTIAIGLPGIPSNGRAKKAFVSIETNAVRWRDDTTAPTAAIGHPIAAAGTLEYEGSFDNLKFIRSGAADAVLNITYYG